MIETIVAFIQQTVFPLGALGVFVAEFVEEVIVPIPSAMILLGSGFVFLKGSISLSFLNTLFFTVVIPATAGLTIGSLVIYLLVFKFEKPFIEKFGKYLTIEQKDLDQMNERFNSGKLDEIFIILARIFPIVPSVVIAVFCGLIKMPWKKYLIITIIGAFFRSLILSLVGWQVGELYIKYAGAIGKIENTGLILLVVAFLGFVGYRKFNKKVL
jgi:membrane protein DedA with SNARE-associated domain